MDSGHNPTSPMPGNGPAPAVPPTPVTPTPPTVPPVAPSAPNPAPSATPFTPPAPQAASVMNSRRTRSSRPASANNMVAVPPQPATNDIVLNSGPAPKKGINKGLIIGIIAAAVLVVGGIAALLLLPKGGGNSNKSQVQEAFAKYANLVINGDENNSEEPIIKSTSEWEIAKIIQADTEKNQDYITALSSYNTDFLTLVTSGTLKDNAELTTRATESKNFLEAYMVYATLGDTADDVADAYVSGGHNAALQKIESQYQNFNEQQKNLTSGAKKYLELWLRVFEIASQKGCLNGNIIERTNDNCTNDSEFRDTYESFERQSSRMSKDADNILMQMSANFSSIRRELYDGK